MRQEWTLAQERKADIRCPIVFKGAVDWLALKRQGVEDTFADATKRLSGDATLHGLVGEPNSRGRRRVCISSAFAQSKTKK